MPDIREIQDIVRDTARRERRTIRCKALGEFRTILKNMEREADLGGDKSEWPDDSDELVGWQNFQEGVIACREALDTFLEGEKKVDAYLRPVI
jgi:hypothetical protein|tara:strand:- start:133 stop:411 length:279 start_codon:yes stop_codon:yes gene_type:complete